MPSIQTSGISPERQNLIIFAKESSHHERNQGTCYSWLPAALTAESSSTCLMPTIVSTVACKLNVVILRKCRFGACIWVKDSYLIKAASAWIWEAMGWDANISKGAQKGAGDCCLLFCLFWWDKIYIYCLHFITTQYRLNSCCWFSSWGFYEDKRKS